MPGRILRVEPSSVSCDAPSSFSSTLPYESPTVGDLGPIWTSVNGGGLGRRGELEGETPAAAMLDDLGTIRSGQGRGRGKRAASRWTGEVEVAVELEVQVDVGRLEEPPVGARDAHRGKALSPKPRSQKRNVIAYHIRSPHTRRNTAPSALSSFVCWIWPDMSQVMDDDDGPPELVDVAALPDSEKPASLRPKAADDPGLSRVPITLVTGRRRPRGCSRRKIHAELSSIIWLICVGSVWGCIH